MRVLQVVYDCIPDAGSEPGIGWQYVMLAARSNDVTVVTRSHHREAIEASPHAAKVRWEYVDVPPLPGRLARLGSLTDTIDCMRWLRPVVERARALHEERPFDLTHYVTLGAPWLPEPVYTLGIPHVCGPLTSASEAPPILVDALGPAARRNARVRALFQRTMESTPHSRRKVRNPSTLCVTSSPAVADRLRARGGANVLLYRQPFAQSRAQIAVLDSYPRPEPTDPIRFVVSGRMTMWKGHAQAIEGFAQVTARHPDAELHVMGWGPEESRLRALVDRLGLGPNVVFHGSVHREVERRIMASCHVFVLPSVRDAGATLLVHAMAIGLPVVAFDTPNVARMTGGAGLLVFPRRPEDAARTIGQAMLELADDPARRETMGRVGRERVDALFSSDVMQADLEEWYRLVVGGSHAPDRRHGACAR